MTDLCISWFSVLFSSVTKQTDQLFLPVGDSNSRTCIVQTKCSSVDYNNHQSATSTLFLSSSFLNLKVSKTSKPCFPTQWRKIWLSSSFWSATVGFKYSTKRCIGIMFTCSTQLLQPNVAAHTRQAAHVKSRDRKRKHHLRHHWELLRYKSKLLWIIGCLDLRTDKELCTKRNLGLLSFFSVVFAIDFTVTVDFIPKVFDTEMSRHSMNCNTVKRKKIIQ